MKNHSRNPCLPMWLVVVCLCVTSVAQISLPPGLAAPDSQPTASTPKDPFGRQSPQSAVLNFLRVAHHGDYVVAARYLELPGPKEKRIGPELARKLLNLMDTSLLGSVATLSTSPEGLSRHRYFISKWNARSKQHREFVATKQVSDSYNVGFEQSVFP